MTGHRTPPRSARAIVERHGEGSFDHALHSGAGRNTIQFHFAGEMTMPVAVQTWVLEPGASEGAHVHDQEGQELEEFYLVLDGVAEMHLEGANRVLHSGDSALCPPTVSRGVSNPGPGPLRLLVVWGPPGAVDFSGFATYQKALAARQG